MTHPNSQHNPFSIREHSKFQKDMMEQLMKNGFGRPISMYLSAHCTNLLAHNAIDENSLKRIIDSRNITTQFHKLSEKKKKQISKIFKKNVETVIANRNYRNNDEKSNNSHNNEDEKCSELVHFKSKILFELYIRYSHRTCYNKMKAVIDNVMEQAINDEHDLESLKDDILDEENSQIISSIQEEYDEAESKIVQMIVDILKSSFIPWHDLIWDVNKNEIDEAAALFRGNAAPLFETQYRGKQATTDKDDAALAIAKSIGLKNNIPLLMLFIDLYSRDRMGKHFEINKNKYGTKIEAFGSTYDVSTWAQQYAYFKRKHKNMEHFISAMSVILTRIRPRIDLEERYCIINDDLDAFGQYTIGAIRFVQRNFTKVWKEKQTWNNSMHFDFWIKPKSVLQIHSVDDNTLNNMYKDSNIYQQILNDKKFHAKCFGIDNNIGQYFDKCEWDQCNVYDLPHSQITVDAISKTLNHLYRFLNHDHTHQRYVFIIDRSNIEEKEQSDHIYIIKPPNKNHSTVSTKCKLFPESFLGKSMQCLLPRNICSQDIGVKSRMKGYMFCLSFHVYSMDCIRVYWSFNGGTDRFLIEDINNIWPRYFRMNTADKIPIPQYADIDLHTIDKLTEMDREFEFLKINTKK